MLTAYELFRSFPEEEFQRLARKAIKALRTAVDEWKDICKLSLHGLNDDDKFIVSEILRSEMSNDNRIKVINTYEKYLSLCKQSHGATINKDVIKVVPIETLYSFNNVKRTSSRISALCPFHNENTPSFVIYKKSNTFHCFGCQANGDAISFVMRLHNISFIDAIKMLGGQDAN